MGERAVEKERDKAGNASGAHESGRYQIEPETQVTSKPGPQPLAAGASNSAILSVHRISEEELEWIEERTSRAPRPANTQQLIPAAVDSEDIPTLGALRPYYREPTLERVQLQFEDKSLDPSQNPLALSSLRPPPKRHPISSQMILSGVGALALVGVGYLAALASGGGRTSQTSFAPASEHAPRIELVNPPSMQFEPSERPAQEPAAAEQSVPWSAVDALPVNEPIEPAKAEPVAPAPAAPAPTAAAPASIRHPRVARSRGPQRTDSVPTGLPAQPSRDDIKTAIESSRAAVQACAGSGHGLTTAHITILGSGRVSAANIEGAFAGTPQGSCMARALRAATFPRFSAPSLQVTYPFRL